MPIFKKAPVEKETAEQAAQIRKAAERLAKVVATASAKGNALSNARQAPRSPGHNVGEIQAPGLPSTSCLVVDRNSFGLRLRLHSPLRLPDEIRLSIPTLGIEGVVRKRWVQDLDVGVEFVVWDGPTDTATTPSASARRKNELDLNLRSAGEPSRD